MTLPAFPTVRGLKFKGSGTPEIFPVLGGTTLGSSQGTLGSLESGSVHNTTGPRVTSRTIEAFGKEFALQGNDVRERNTGGIDNWGVVFSPVFTTTYVPIGADSGWHMLHPAGRPTLAFMYSGLPSFHIGVVFTTDGVNWSVVPISGNSDLHGKGTAITYRDSIFWATGTNVGTLIEYNFLTSAATLYFVAGDFASRFQSFCVNGSDLYFFGSKASFSRFALYRFQGGSFVEVAANAIVGLGNNHQTGSAMFPDGDDIVCLFNGAGTGCFCNRFTDVKASPAQSDITSPVLDGFGIKTGEGGATGTASWEVIVDNDSAPGVPPAVHLWRTPGPAQAGTRVAYTWHFRAMTHDGATIFTLGEEVTGGTSGARGDVTEISAGKVHLTNVVGTFQSGEVLTGTSSSDSATSTSVLTEQNATQVGTSISADFSLPSTTEALGPFVLADPQARVEIGINGVRLAHGAIGGVGPANWVLKETVTGGTSGATGVVFIDNLGNIVVYPTNVGPFQNGELITGDDHGANATLNLAPEDDVSIPSREVAGGTRHYCRVWGTAPDPVPTTTLYSSEQEQAPWRRESILSLALEVGTAPGLAPTISAGPTPPAGAMLNLPADDGGRVWSFVHDSTAFPPGTILELMLDGV